jgi:hypothetical protein
VCGAIRRPGVPPTSPAPGRLSLRSTELFPAFAALFVDTTSTPPPTRTPSPEHTKELDSPTCVTKGLVVLYSCLFSCWHMLALLCPRCPRVRPVRVRRLALPLAQAQALGCLRGSICPTAPCPAAGMLWLAGSATTTSPRTTATPGGAACWALRGCEAPSGGLRCGKPPCAGTRTGFLPPARTRPGPGPGPGSGPGPGPRPRSQSQRARCRTG